MAEFDDLDWVMSWQEPRTVSGSLTVQYDKVIFLLEPNTTTAAIKRKKVVIHDYPDGRLEIRYDGLPLPYSRFDKLRQVNQAQVVNNKRLGAALAHIKKNQETRRLQRSRKSPRRRGQENSQFVTA